MSREVLGDELGGVPVTLIFVDIHASPRFDTEWL
jgi:hypothetical protein